MAWMFAGELGAGLLGPLLGMIPPADGGPANPYAGTGTGNPIDPLMSLFGGLFGGSGGGGGSGSSGSSGSSGNNYNGGYSTGTVNYNSMMSSPAVLAGGVVVLLLLLRR